MDDCLKVDPYDYYDEVADVWWVTVRDYDELKLIQARRQGCLAFCMHYTPKIELVKLFVRIFIGSGIATFTLVTYGPAVFGAWKRCLGYVCLFGACVVLKIGWVLLGLYDWLK